MASRYTSAKRLNRLPPLERALLAARVLLAVESGLVDDKEAGRVLREAMGVQWSLLTAIQYLSGQEAIRAIDSLPEGWLSGDMTKVRAVEAVLKAGWVWRVCRILCKRDFGLQLRQTALELDGKAVQSGLPVADRHRPFLADVA